MSVFPVCPQSPFSLKQQDTEAKILDESLNQKERREFLREAHFRALEYV